MTTILIIAGILALIFIIWKIFFSVELQLQTVNFYSGGLGSGKTLTTTKTAIKLRNKSKLAYFLLGKRPEITYMIFYVAIQIIAGFTNIKLLFITMPFMSIFTPIIFKKRQVIKSKCQMREIYSTYPILLEKGKKGKEDIYSKKFEVEHLLGHYELPEKVIVVIDEASKYFPNEAKKSPILLTESIRWFRHFTNGTIIMADQSIGDINIAIRRRINVVYNFSSFKKILWKFYSIEVSRINYVEDIVINTNDINNLKQKRLFDLFGKKRYESRYFKKNYKPEEVQDNRWDDYYI